jgi:hypothetical protein
VIRRSFVVLVALVFAVASGIALGAGPLSTAQTEPPAAVEPQPERAEPRADPRAAYADTFAAAASNRLLTGQELAGRTVAVVRFPGVPDDQLGELTAAVGATGASVSAVYAVQPALVDLGQRSLVDTLGAQLAAQLGEVAVPEDATAYERVGSLLGAVVAAKMRKGAAPASDAPTIEQSLASAGLVTAQTSAQARAPLVLVVLGDELAPDADQVVAGLVTGLAGSARGVVVAGPAATAEEGHVLARLRASQRTTDQSNGPIAGVTTVDGVDGPAGRVTAALALVRSFTEPGGAYGASGSDGAVPMG